MIDCFGDCDQPTGTWGTCETVECDQLLETTFSSSQSFSLPDCGYRASDINTEGAYVYNVWTWQEEIDVTTVKNPPTDNGFDISIESANLNNPGCPTSRISPLSTEWKNVSSTSAELWVYYPPLNEFDECYEVNCGEIYVSYNATSDNQIKNLDGSKRLEDISELRTGWCSCS